MRTLSRCGGRLGDDLVVQPLDLGRPLVAQKGKLLQLSSSARPAQLGTRTLPCSASREELPGYDATVATEILAGAEPFSATGGPVGVLVLHGFTGNPQSMRPLANAFAAAGFAVELPLAARARHERRGHGAHAMARTGRTAAEAA